MTAQEARDLVTATENEQKESYLNSVYAKIRKHIKDMPFNYKKKLSDPRHELNNAFKNCVFVDDLLTVDIQTLESQGYTINSHLDSDGINFYEISWQQ